MSDEIKEILDNVKKCCDIMEDNNFVVYQKQDILKLLDYITNLQQKYEEADNDRHKLFEQKEKAIEYINHEIFKRTILVGVGTKKYTRNILDNVLNILNGGDKE